MEEVTMQSNIVGSTGINKISYVSNYEEVRKIYKKLSSLRKTDPSSKEVQLLVARMQTTKLTTKYSKSRKYISSAYIIGRYMDSFDTNELTPVFGSNEYR